MYKLLRPLLFSFDAESVHRFAMTVLRLGLAPSATRAMARWFFDRTAPELEQTIWGLDFPNPVGLAAGFDKNAECVNQLAALGFGHVEAGTVTGLPQEGNPRPRMFRLPEDEGLLNRMGFNNEGSETVAQRLDATDIEPTLGVNIGKSKGVENEDAAADYKRSFRRLFGAADYFVVNVSSPNTPELRDLQRYEPLRDLLAHLQALNGRLADARATDERPLLVKFSPDLSEAELDAGLRVVTGLEVDGVIATNTTTRRDGLETPEQESLGDGGVSGRPLTDRSRGVIRKIYRATEGDVPIIGVGGIFSAGDALRAITAGASLVQVWTGFVYEGPGLPRRINEGLLQTCRKHGWDSIAEARGQACTHE